MTTSLQSATPYCRLKLQASNRSAKWAHHMAHSEEGLDMDQPYQRGDVWTKDQQRLLIRSLKQGIPVPAIVANDRHGAGYQDPLGDKDGRYAIVDGKQRSRAVIDWYDGKLDVPASWFDPQEIASTHDTLDGPYVTYDELTPTGQRICTTDFVLPVVESQLKTMGQEADLFVLLNRGGTPMTEQDLAAAMQMSSAS